MKKYQIPEIAVKRFAGENVVTASGDDVAAVEQQLNADKKTKAVQWNKAWDVISFQD